MTKLVIFGTGKCSDRVENVLHKDRVHIAAYLDNSVERQWTTRKGIDVLPPVEVKRLEYDYIIISTKRYQEVIDQLQLYKIPQEKIIGYYEDNSERYDELKEILDISKWDRAVLQDKIDAEIDSLKKVMNIYMANLEYEVADKLDKQKYFFPEFYPLGVTIEKIINDKCSLCRFGDGEFELMEGRARPKFQDVDEKLAIRLREVIASQREDILIAIADNYGSLDNFTDEAALAIRSYMTKETRESHYRFLGRDRKYHNAYLTRPYVMMKDKSLAGKCFEEIKRVWDNRDITVIEGKFTRMGVGNDLFSNAKSVQRILAPEKNAFSVYEELREAAMLTERERLVLLSLGPSATVLAYDMAKAGYQAVDVGHLDNEYEWYLAGVKERTAIPHKYVNEVRGGEVVGEFRDDEYEKQVIAVIRSKAKLCLVSSAE